MKTYALDHTIAATTVVEEGNATTRDYPSEPVYQFRSMINEIYIQSADWLL